MPTALSVDADMSRALEEAKQQNMERAAAEIEEGLAKHARHAVTPLDYSLGYEKPLAEPTRS